MSSTLQIQPGRPRPSGPRQPKARRSVDRLRAMRDEDVELRHIVLRVREWGLSNGDACRTDALTVVIAVALEDARIGIESPTLWTAERMRDLREIDVPVLCAHFMISRPTGVADALRQWCKYLAAQQNLAAGSDCLDVLLRAAGADTPERDRHSHRGGRGA